MATVGAPRKAGTGGKMTSPSAPASTSRFASSVPAAVLVTLRPERNVVCPARTGLHRRTTSSCSLMSSELTSLTAMFMAMARGLPAATPAIYRSSVARSIAPVSSNGRTGAAMIPDDSGCDMTHSSPSRGMLGQDLTRPAATRIYVSAFLAFWQASPAHAKYRRMRGHRASRRERRIGMADHSHCIVAERPSAHVALFRIARPEKRNALHSSMVIALSRLLEAAAADRDVRCAILTGDERCFAAGADIAEMVERGPAGTSNNPERVAAWRKLERFPKPIIAAVNGIAFGAGNELALTCDFIVAGRNAQFGQPEVKIGGMAGDGGTQRLPRKIGANMASYMLMTGEPIDAETALRLGLAVELCEPGK